MLWFTGAPVYRCSPSYIYTQSSTEDLELIIFLIDGDNSTNTKKRTCPLCRTNRSVQMKLKFVVFFFALMLNPIYSFFNFKVNNNTNYLK